MVRRQNLNLFSPVSLLLLTTFVLLLNGQINLGASTPKPPPATQQQQQPPRRQQPADDEFLIGVGIADITGPAADINLMGYAKPNQDAGGIHLRQFSRSIIIEDKFGSRVLYTSIDNGMISQLLRVQVLKRLKQNYGQHMFNESNVMMTATHSHSCPGGFFQYMLYNIPSAGYISQTLEALVDGIVRSVERANENMKPGRIYYNEGELLDASINRSPTSYLNNPIEERANYKHNTDTGMYLLKMVDKAGEPLAMINWFAVHGTSMNNTNHLISSDNKGYASILFEQEFNPVGTLPGKGKFVAIFAQANEGDVSPNTLGPRCVDSGLPCDSATSTCGNPPRNEKCIAFGPGKDMFESTKIIAYKQYYKARQLFMDQSSQVPIRGPVKFIHEHIDITQQTVPLYKSVVDLARNQMPNPKLSINATYKTCPAGLGYSFAAGTTDGPGAFDFQQGDTVSTRYWNMVRDFLRRPSEEQTKCHSPKPILLSTGEMDFPYMWHPKVVPTQIIMVGQLAIAGLPGEFTTMAGRRVRNAIRATLTNGGGSTRDWIPPPREVLADGIDLEEAGLSPPSSDGGDDDEEDGDKGGDQDGGKMKALRRNGRVSSQLVSTNNADDNTSPIKVVLSGLSNIYTSYITTVEEYEIQRYEGASTLYGPHTLQAYINQFKRLASHLATGKPLQANQLEPPDLTNSLFTLKTGVIYDGTQKGRSFGEVLNNVNSSKVYKCKDSVQVSFVAGNPRNDLRQEDSFLYVDKYTSNGTWTPIATDGSWETKFIWERTNTFFGESRATVVWDVPHNCESGVYRIRHYGAHKSLIMQAVSQYSGQSLPFKVSSSDNADESNELDTTLESAIESGVQASLDEMNQKRLEMDDRQFSANSNGADKAHQPSFYSPLNLLRSMFGWRARN